MHIALTLRRTLSSEKVTNTKQLLTVQYFERITHSVLHLIECIIFT